MFLNKIDLFAEKLPCSPLGDHLPDFNGGNNYDAACDSILHRFVSLNRSAATKQQIKCKLVQFRANLHRLRMIQSF
jgi:guanine nucleotide-binding protein subunit alpha